MMTKDDFLTAMSEFQKGLLSKSDIAALIKSAYQNHSEVLYEYASEINRKKNDRTVKLRGLIEFTNICKSDCYYCGIRASNKDCFRYRLTTAQILECCDTGYQLGFRTFVLQGGEDPYFTDERLCDILRSIKERYPECAITLSIGERGFESYQALYNAGAKRFLLRHETASSNHYSRLHPENMLWETRKKCLFHLKEIGFETGAGFMVGSPYQNYEDLADDLLFLHELQPEMVGIGAFIPHENTPMRDFPAGSLKLTIIMVAFTRILLPDANIPATTSLATLSSDGRLEALRAGANVVMPNLSPKKYRSFYTLYNGKPATGEEAAESLDKLKQQLESAGYSLEIAPVKLKDEANHE